MKNSGYYMMMTAVLAAILIQGCFQSKEGGTQTRSSSSVSSIVSSAAISSKTSSVTSEPFSSASSAISQEGNVSSEGFSSSLAAIASSSLQSSSVETIPVSSSAQGNTASSVSSVPPAGTSSASSVSSASRSSAGTVAAVLSALEVEIPVAELPENNETIVTVTGSYSDGSTRHFTSGVTWQIDKPNVVGIKQGKLLAKSEGIVSIKAEVDGKVSDAKSFTVYKVIHGHRLPPEPDPAINNSTLLGIDSNDNGVRDDVERWIYLTYDHPLEQGLFMQSARAYQKVIIDPGKALETKKYIDTSSACIYYRIDHNQYLGEKYEFVHPTKEVKQKQFNTIKRHIAYKRYDSMLSGRVFSVVRANILACEYDENGTKKK